MKERKRAPGAGRKSKGEFSGVTSPLSIRMPEDMRKRLKATADANGRSLSQEVLRLINEAFRHDQDKARDRPMRAFCFLIGQLANEVAGLTDDKGQPAFDWRTNPFFFRAFKLAVAKVLDALEPAGEMRPPQEMLNAQLQEENAEGLSILKILKATYETPEARADQAVQNLMSSLMDPRFKARYFDEVAPNHKATGLREYYGFRDARRDQLKVEKS